jgi:NDP-sugar pyrophosphorylase family protein
MVPVIILAGGLATRMRPVTEKIPKAMIEVNGKPFIHHQLTLLEKNGISEVILCSGYLGEQIEKYVGNGSSYHIYVEYSYDGDALLGTGGAIAKIGDKLPDAFFVLYGDSYLDIDYQKVEQAYKVSSKKGLMTVFKNENQWDTSNVVFQDNTVIKYSKTNKTKDMRYIDYGLGILQKSAFAEFPSDTVFDLAAVYEQLSNEKQLEGYEVFERFYEIGSPQGLADLCKKL